MGRGKTKTKTNGAGNKPRRRAKQSKRDGSPFSFRSAGSRLGEYIGSGAGSLLGKIFGMGAYTVEQNVLLTPTGTIGPPPIFQTSPDGSVIVCHREFVSTISGSSAYTTQLAQPINPSNPFLFPRLSQLAPTFEEYEPLGLVFEYLTTSGTAVGSTNTALGTVMLATNYDVLDPLFQSKQELESYKFSTATVPCSSVYHPIECKPNQLVGSTRYISDPSYYTPAGGSSLQTGADRRLYDLGLFQVATQGQQATNNQGEIWVSYCFRFKVPRANPYTTVLHISSNSTGTAAAPFTGAVVTSGSSMVTNLTGTTFTIPSPGDYMLIMSAISNVTVGLAAISFSAGSNLTGTNMLNNYSATFVDATNGTSKAMFMNSFTCNAAGSAAANTFTISALTNGSLISVDLLVLRRPKAGTSPTTGF